MQDESNRPRRIDPRLRVALSHRKRYEILAYLMQKREGTGKREMADALDLTIPLGKYHLKVLQDADLIADVEDERGSGQAGRSYIATASR